MKTTEKVYDGDIEITKENQKEWQEKLKDITEITGYLSIYSNATLNAPNLSSVGSSLWLSSNSTLITPNLSSVGDSIDIKSNHKLEKQLYENHKKNTWYINEYSSEWLINKNIPNAKYSLDNYWSYISKELFLKIKTTLLPINETFNLEKKYVPFFILNVTSAHNLANSFKLFNKQTDFRTIYHNDIKKSPISPTSQQLILTHARENIN